MCDVSIGSNFLVNSGCLCNNVVTLIVIIQMSTYIHWLICSRSECSDRHDPALNVTYGEYVFFVGFLVSLLLVHCVWFALILKSVVRSLYNRAIVDARVDNEQGEKNNQEQLQVKEA